MKAALWHYRARVVRWVDGDTLDALLDLGFYISHAQRFRLLGSAYGIDTPEINSTDPGERTRAALAADRCRALAPDGAEVILRTARAPTRDGFGRFLAEVLIEDGRSVGDVLLAEGLAEIWMRSR